MRNWMAPESHTRQYAEDCERHMRAIDKLVRDLGVPADEVNRTYYGVLDELNKSVVPAFLPILVSINVKERLTTKQISCEDDWSLSLAKILR
jgi:hypothetical protein